MSLREKFAWAALITIIVGVCTYAVAVVLGYQQVIRYHHVLWTALCLLIAIILLPLLIRALLAMRMPRGAVTEQDERERLFELKATRIAFFVLAVGLMLSTFFIIHAPATPLDIANGVLGITVVAYLIKFGAEIRYHRRGY